MSRTQLIDDGVLTARAAPERTALALYATACALAVGALLLTNWPTYSFAIGGGIIPLYYYVVPGVLAIPILFAHPEIPLRFLKEPLFWWFAALVGTGLLWQVVAQDFSEESNQQLRLRLLVFFVFGTTAILCFASRPMPIALLIMFCVLLGGAFNWFDALRPFRFVPQGHVDSNEGRGAGLFINPNIAGNFVVMGTIAALPFIPMRFRAVALTAAVMCIAPTFSRGAFVLIALVSLASIALRLVSRFQALLMVVTLPLLVAGVGVAYDYLMTHSEDRNMQRVVQRLMVFTEGGEDDESVDLRADAAARAWELFTQSPLYGTGLGTTTARSFVTGTHNMYAMLMAEHGIFGLALYLWLLFVVTLAGWRVMRHAPTQRGVDIGKATMVFALYFAVNGFFSHNVLDETQGMFLLAFMIAAGLQASQAWLPEPAHTRLEGHRPLRPPPRLIRW